LTETRLKHFLKSPSGIDAWWNSDGFCSRFKFHIDNYLVDNNEDNFMGNTLLCIENTKTLLDKLRFLILGDRHHKWMYDEKSLCRLLESAGSANPRF